MANFCEKDKCDYYKKYSGVQKYQGGFLPLFGSIDERCTHPKVNTRNEKDAPGIKLMSLKNCPK